MNRPALHLIGSGPEKVSDLPRVTQLVSGRGLVLFPESMLPPVFPCHLLTSWTGDSPALVITAGHSPGLPPSSPSLVWDSEVTLCFIRVPVLCWRQQLHRACFRFLFSLGLCLLLHSSAAQDNFDPGRLPCKEVLQGPARSLKTWVPTERRCLEQGVVLLWKGLRLVFPSSVQVNYCLKFLGGFLWWRLCELCLLDAGSCYFLPSCPGCKTKGAVYLAHLATGTVHLFY